MRRTLFAVLFLIFAVFFPFTAAWAGYSLFTIGSYEYVKDGTTYSMDVAPYIKNGRAYGPIRYVAQALDVPISNILWDEAAQTVTLLKGDRAVQLKIGSSDMIINGITSNMDVPVEITIGRTMLPFRFVAQALGASVAWDENTQQVIVETDGSVRSTTVNQNPQRQPLSSKQVAALVRPALVRVETHRSSGSGFFVSSDGLVLTSAHVARGSREISITTPNGERFPARLLKINNRTDLALLKAETAPGRSFPIIKQMAYIDRVQIGEEVLAFGNPYGLDWSVTRGIVGAKREESPSLGAWTANVLLIQHDAATAPGSSGGPLVNLYGEWIGVHTMDLRGFKFAVPADHYYWLARQENYSLKDDWLSYYVEDYCWNKEWERILPIINDARAAPWGPRKVDLLSEALPMLRALRDEAANYQPVYVEIQSLHQLQLELLDASGIYNTFILNVATNRVQWSQSLHDTLWNNLGRARTAFNTGWRHINALSR